MDDAADALSYALRGAIMGCDINWYSETKKEGIWQCDQKESFISANESGGFSEMGSLSDSGRDYSFFGLLQNVRESWDWSFKDRILFPEDASPEVTAIFRQWNNGAHSEGHRTRAELKEKLTELLLLRTDRLIMPNEDEKDIYRDTTRLTDLIEALDSAVPDTDQRVVFWFDN